MAVVTELKGHPGVKIYAPDPAQLEFIRTDEPTEGFVSLPTESDLIELSSRVEPR